MATKIAQKENKAAKALETVDAITTLAEAKVVLKKLIQAVLQLRQDVRRLKKMANLIKEEL